MPFTNRAGWQSTQQECSYLRLTHSHLSQGYYIMRRDSLSYRGCYFLRKHVSCFKMLSFSKLFVSEKMMPGALLDGLDENTSSCTKHSTCLTGHGSWIIKHAYLHSSSVWPSIPQLWIKILPSRAKYTVVTIETNLIFQLLKFAIFCFAEGKLRATSECHIV